MNINFFNEEKLASYDKKSAYIFGCGDFALRVLDLLQRAGIKPTAFCVDDDYWQKGQSIKGLPVLPLSALQDLAEDSYHLFFAVALPSRLHDFRKRSWPQEICMIFNLPGTWDYDDAFFAQHAEALNETRALLCDELSRRTMDDFLTAKRTGDGSASMQDTIDGTYYNEVTRSARHMTGALVDCGAYNGDSVAEFFDFIGRDDVPVYAFEPDHDNFRALTERFRHLPEVHCLPYGTWDEETTLAFNASGDESSSLLEDSREPLPAAETIQVPVKTIDQMLGNAKASFIKMDIEGAELRTLKGGRGTIERDLPILAISAYHKITDLVELPQYINEIAPGRYKFYLRHHGCVCAELVLYAIPAEDAD